MLRNGRENFLIGAMICIVMGAFLTVGGVYSMGATIGVSGLVLFVVGMSMKTQRGMTPEEIETWTPEAEQLPDAGRVMYRIDTTLDEPIRTSVLCGPCGKVTLVDGSKPAYFSCPECEIHLWDEEE
ncbi:hypothetical protein N9J16_00525 [Candidatus Poseidoniaceae archaeon]|jgi:hypothetical protein|nr:hypothetical protein [Euryarchaeota archaeon]MDA9117211.1 hypothetical protein [Candidatus Poseidoniaceae archaeon]|tara:strand:- start:7968 stop:8345 length:378 start_codon:yes stop_codon:yes gene_type:complete